MTREDMILLARWLIAEGGTLEEFLDVLEKPHRWKPELTAARALADIADTCCGKCPGGSCYVDQITGA